MEIDDDYDASLRRMAEQRVGHTLGNKYTLESILGVGGMATVYAGSHRNGHRVAIKVLHPEIAVVPDLRARFLREGYVANKVGHRGAVRVLDDDVTEDGTVYLVMELLEGATLATVLRDAGGALTEDAVAPLAAQLLETLTAAHRAGIVHRDIKPDNVFVELGGSVKILDFGIARVAHENKTRSGRVLGTPEFMAPEQAKGKTREVDARTDVYAVGAVLFRALSGRNVHEGETPEMSAILAATERPPKLSEVAPSVAAALASIVDRALLPEKAERWASADAMREALLAAVPRERWKSSLPTHDDLLRLRAADAARRSATVADGQPSIGGLSTPIGRRAPRARTIAIGAAALAIAAVGTLGLSLRPREHRRSEPSAVELPTPEAKPTTVLPPASSAIDSPPPHQATASTAPTSPAASVSAKPAVSTHTTKSSGTRPNAAPSASTQAKSECVPPWRLSATGTREYKLECFQK